MVLFFPFPGVERCPFLLSSSFLTSSWLHLANGLKWVVIFSFLHQPSPATEYNYDRCDVAAGPLFWGILSSDSQCGTVLSYQSEGTPINLCGAVAFPSGTPTFAVSGYDTTRLRPVLEKKRNSKHQRPLDDECLQHRSFHLSLCQRQPSRQNSTFQKFPCFFLRIGR